MTLPFAFRVHGWPRSHRDASDSTVSPRALRPSQGGPDHRLNVRAASHQVHIPGGYSGRFLVQNPVDRFAERAADVTGKSSRVILIIR